MFHIFRTLDRKVIFAMLFFAVSVTLLAVPELRKWAQQQFIPERKVLSVVSGTVYDASPFNKVVKILTRTGIVLEIYARKNGKESLIDRVPLADVHDAYYEINARPTNLALNDLDGDGTPEIIAPTFDLQWQPKLNIFRFNSENGHFEPY